MICKENTIPPEKRTDTEAPEPQPKVKANPMITAADGKFYPIAVQAENKIPAVYPAVDNDLAVENFTNDFDMTLADIQDLK